jgi:hypothetical protein
MGCIVLPDLGSIMVGSGHAPHVARPSPDLVGRAYESCISKALATFVPTLYIKIGDMLVTISCCLPM